MAHLEDLIARLQQWLKSISGTGRQIPDDLEKAIEEEQVKTFGKFRKQRKSKEDKKYKKELWKMARHDYLQKCAEEFEKKHPDPDPIMYG